MERCVVIASDKVEAAQVTASVRAALRDAQVLKKKSVTLQALDAVHGTLAERGLPQFYKAGQVVQFSQHAKGFKAGQRYTVVGHDPFGHVLARKGLFIEALPLSHPERFDTFTARDLELSPGDVVRVTKSGAATSRPLFPGVLNRPWHHRLESGSLQRVKSVSRDGIRLGNGILVPLDFGHLSHGYCVTAHGVEGRSVDRVLLIANTGRPESERLQAAASAARKGLHVFTDDRETLEANVRLGPERMFATDLTTANPGTSPPLHRQPPREPERDR